MINPFYSFILNCTLLYHFPCSVYDCNGNTFNDFWFLYCTMLFDLIAHTLNFIDFYCFELYCLIRAFDFVWPFIIWLVFLICTLSIFTLHYRLWFSCDLYWSSLVLWTVITLMRNMYALFHAVYYQLLWTRMIFNHTIIVCTTTKHFNLFFSLFEYSLYLFEIGMKKSSYHLRCPSI